MTELCSTTVVTTWSPSRSVPWMTRLRDIVALRVNTSRLGSFGLPASIRLRLKKAVRRLRVEWIISSACRARSQPVRPGFTP